MRITLACIALVSTDAVRYSSKSLNFKDHTKSFDCNNDCGASLWDGFSCDYCKGSGGRDTCVYSPVKSFESKSYSEKVQFYDDKIQKAGLVNPETRSAGELLPVLLASSVQTSFDNFAPEMPSGRVKGIHTLASHCKINLEVGSSPYTGLLSEGSHQGFIRMGPAGPVGEGGMTPGLGFKFPRSGIHSGDFVSMWNTDGDQSLNFFASNMSNKISPATGALVVLANKFEQATICSTQVGLSDFCTYDQSGRKSSPKFPYKLFFSPTKEVQQNTDSSKTKDDVLNEISFPSGTKIFDVYACGSPMGDESSPVSTLEKSCGSPLPLGSITTTGQCVRSDYGDKSLHIRHQRIEEDWALRPDFKTGPAACGRTSSDWSAGSPKGCKNAFSTSMLDTDE